MITSLRKCRQTLKVALTFAVIISTYPAYAQNRERQELLERINSNIRIAPNAACAYPQRQIEELLPELVDQNGLMENISRTVFNRAQGDNSNASGYAALLERTRAETARREAEIEAFYRARETGGQVPVGDQPLPEGPDYDARVVFPVSTYGADLRL